VSCGPEPEVAYTTRVSTGKLFEDTATFTCHDGYSMDGSAAGEKEFSIHCQKNGSWGGVATPEIIS
jgi:hypothetical protein